MCDGDCKGEWDGVMVVRQGAWGAGVAGRSYWSRAVGVAGVRGGAGLVQGEALYAGN